MEVELHSRDLALEAQKAISVAKVSIFFFFLKKIHCYELLINLLNNIDSFIWAFSCRILLKCVNYIQKTFQTIVDIVKCIISCCAFS